MVFSDLRENTPFERARSIDAKWHNLMMWVCAPPLWKLRMVCAGEFDYLVKSDALMMQHVRRVAA